MGWASGSYIAQDVWNLVREYIPEDRRQTLAKNIFKIFKSEDADDWDSTSTLCKDADVYQDYEEENDGT